MGPKNSNRAVDRKVTKRIQNTWTEKDIQNATHELNLLPRISGKLQPIEFTRTNVSLEHLLLDKVKPIQEKQKENRMSLDLGANVENQCICIYIYIYIHTYIICAFLSL